MSPVPGQSRSVPNSPETGHAIGIFEDLNGFPYSDFSRGKKQLKNVTFWQDHCSLPSLRQFAHPSNLSRGMLPIVAAFSADFAQSKRGCSAVCSPCDMSKELSFYQKWCFKSLLKSLYKL